VAAVQVLLVALAPSHAPGAGRTVTQEVASGPGAGSALTPGQATSPAAATATGGGGAAVSTGGGGYTAGSTRQGTAGGQPAGVAGPGGVAPGPGGSTVQDLSKCDKSGRQIGPSYYMPPCAPVWHGGNNGGQTMTGVFADHTNYVYYSAKSDPTVNAILATQNLAATSEQACEAHQAFETEINKRWEFYGRKFASLNGPGANQGSTAQSPCHWPYFQGQCTLTPPDPPCERAEADVIARMKPAYVIAPVADPAFYDELAKNQIMVAGGESEPAAYHDNSAPYYYDVLMDGTRAANIDGEYWCKKLNNKPVSHAGADVMSVRNWGPTPGAPPIRKVAVFFPATNGDPSFKLSVDAFVHDVTGGMCSTPAGVLEIPYQSDITTAQQQASTQVNELIQNHITSVICFCDPIAPVFLTATMKNNGYFPEHVLSGIGLIDYDLLGRLYDPTEWSHAFGPSQLAEPFAFASSEAAKAWVDTGNSGQPDGTENLAWAYYALMASSFQSAGPQPTPTVIHQALLSLPPEGGWAITHDPHYELAKVAPPDQWTFFADMREVYWSSSRPSAVDSKSGSYCPVGGGIRFTLGQWPTGDPDVFDPGHNGC
jgi:hypothetical protein